MQGFAQHLKDMGAQGSIGLQHGEIPASIYMFFNEKLSLFGQCPDITELVHGQREIKSAWEIEMLEAGAVIQLKMFDAVAEAGAEGVTELELVAAAEAVSRAEGYGGSVQMRRFPMQCDRGVIIAGRAGGIPSFFDSALGGVGAHPLSSMGSSFNKIKANETVLVDLLHIHRGYVVDATRMFVAGHLDEKWNSRLEDILAVKDTVVDVLGSGETCQQAWRQGLALADEFGHKDHLMGMNPDQSKFLGHSVGLQLDETPVVAEGFDRPLPIGGTMAIEPKLVYSDGSIGSEDTWVRDEDGMRPLTADRAIPWITEW
jgi:Xaa-Pro aminopeptidase